MEYDNMGYPITDPARQDQELRRGILYHIERYSNDDPDTMIRRAEALYNFIKFGPNEVID